jgi:hypothetical protein
MKVFWASLLISVASWAHSQTVPTPDDAAQPHLSIAAIFEKLERHLDGCPLWSDGAANSAYSSSIHIPAHAL